MASNEQIRRFVQDTLGCGCPEEVFRSIDFRTRVQLNNFVSLTARIVIGNRLLIYIAEAGNTGCIEEHLPVLVSAGERERNREGLNRFRLVLTTDEPVEVQRVSGKIFEELRGTDEKMHLHVIHNKDIPFAAGHTEDTEEIKNRHL